MGLEAASQRRRPPSALGEQISIEQQLELALIGRSPAVIAWHFGRHVLQFYDRGRFDRLARIVWRQLLTYSARNADVFRARLDQLLVERDERPIVWVHDDREG